MEPFESHTHSFIITIWREKLVEHGNEFIWRGHITHVADGKRRYLKDLEDITSFIVPYLETMSVRIPLRHRVRLLCERWMRRLMDRR